MRPQRGMSYLCSFWLNFCWLIFSGTISANTCHFTLRSLRHADALTSLGKQISNKSQRYGMGPSTTMIRMPQNIITSQHQTCQLLFVVREASHFAGTAPWLRVCIYLGDSMSLKIYFRIIWWFLQIRVPQNNPILMFTIHLGVPCSKKPQLQ